MRYLSLAIGLLIVSTAAAADPPRDVSVFGTGTEFRLVGELHEPFGTVMTVQGYIVKRSDKGDEGKQLIRVQRINGRATQEGIEIRLERGWSDVKLPELRFGETY